MGKDRLQDTIADGAVKYPPYPEYKESCVDWLGKVPEHWKEKQIGHIFKIHNGATPKSSESDYWNGDINWITPEDLGHNIGKTIRDSRRKITLEGYNNCGVSIASSGSIALSTRAPIGHLAKVELPSCVNQGCRLLEPQEGCEDYWYYTLHSANSTLASRGQGTTFMELPRQSLKSIKSSVPPHEEQQTIAAFLDYKTAKIDALIAKKKVLLDKLAEKRTALISHAVTKGLDPKVSMRDSGIDWLGEIPAHWEVKRLRFAMTTNPSKSEIKLQSDEIVSFIPMESVGEFGGLSLDIEKTIDEVSSGYTYFADSDVVVAKITPCFENGKGALAQNLKKGIAFGTTELHVLRAGDGLSPEYLFNLTVTHPFRKIGESEMFGAGGQKRIPERFIRNFRIGIPPMTEQCKINEFIQDVKAKLSQEKESVRTVITRLQEYRSALITNAVTGKIDVRNFRLPEAEELVTHEE